jgi:C4-dicarboxylate transporter DctQ subunit
VPAGPGSGSPSAPDATPLDEAPRPLRWLDRATAACSGATAALGAVVVLLLAAITGYSVFWRYVLDQPITWSDELSGYLVVLLVMLGVAEALRRGDHINVDLVIARLPAAGRRWATVWGMAATVALGVAILISAIDSVTFTYAMGMVSEGYLELPMWIAKAPIILGAAMLVLAGATALLRALAGLPAHDGDA